MLTRPSRRRRRLVVTAGVLALLLGAGALIGWRVTAAREQGAVVVGADARPFACRAGRVVDVSGDDDPQDVGALQTSALVMSRGLDCDLRFVVDNRGDLPVRVTAVQLPLLGPRSSLSVRATRLDGGFFVVPAASADDGDDARFTLPGDGMDLPAGAQVVLLADLVWKPGCSGKGSTESQIDSPLVTVSVLGTTSTRLSDVDSWAYRGADDGPHCG